MALITLIMAILSQAFTEGLESFRRLKGIGDLNERLRSAASLLRTDVLAAHFGTNRLAQDTLRTGAPDDESADLTTNPVARRLLARSTCSTSSTRRPRLPTIFSGGPWRRH